MSNTTYERDQYGALTLEGKVQEMQAHIEGKRPGCGSGWHDRYPSRQAPAVDSDGSPSWNVWVTGDRSSPHTFHTHDDAVTFATRKTADGLRVYTDFH